MAGAFHSILSIGSLFNFKFGITRPHNLSVSDDTPDHRLDAASLLRAGRLETKHLPRYRSSSSLLHFHFIVAVWRAGVCIGMCGGADGRGGIIDQS